MAFRGQNSGTICQIPDHRAVTSRPCKELSIRAEYDARDRPILPFVDLFTQPIYHPTCGLLIDEPLGEYRFNSRGGLLPLGGARRTTDPENLLFGVGVPYPNRLIFADRGDRRPILPSVLTSDEVL
jgi:hypothetical protein